MGILSRWAARRPAHAPQAGRPVPALAPGGIGVDATRLAALIAKWRVWQAAAPAPSVEARNAALAGQAQRANELELEEMARQIVMEGGGVWYFPDRVGGGGERGLPEGWSRLW